MGVQLGFVRIHKWERFYQFILNLLNKFSFIITTYNFFLLLYLSYKRLIILFQLSRGAEKSKILLTDQVTESQLGNTSFESSMT